MKFEQNNKKNREILAYTTGEENAMVRFDTDSTTIRIDNCATRTMSNSIDDFITSTMTAVEDLQVHGYGGNVVPITQKGTISWYY
jgi:hypothetical protein